MAHRVSVVLSDEKTVTSRNHLDILRIGLVPSSVDQKFRIWATLSYGAGGFRAGAYVGSRLVRGGTTVLSQVTHKASSEPAQRTRDYRTPVFYPVSDAPRTVGEVTYSLSLAKAGHATLAANAIAKAAPGLSLFVESVDGKAFRVVERFVADALVEVTPPAPPAPEPIPTPGSISSLNLSRSGNHVTGTWSESSDADEYKIEWLVNGAVVRTLYRSASSTRSVSRTFSRGQSAGLRIRGVNDDRGQEGSPIFRSVTIPGPDPGPGPVITPTPPPPGPPTDLTFSFDHEDNELTAKWDAGTNADYYQYRHKVGSGSWPSSWTRVDSTTVVISGPKKPTGGVTDLTHYIRVRSRKNDSDAPASASVEASERIPKVPQQPQDLVVKQTSKNQVKASWDASARADHYHVSFRFSFGLGKWRKVTGLSAVHAVTNTQSDDRHRCYVRVKAENKGGYSFITDEDIQLGRPYSVRNASARFYEYSLQYYQPYIKVSWDAPTGAATKYRVRGRSPDETDWSRWHELAETGFDYTNLRGQNGTWEWQIQAGNNIGWSDSVDVSAEAYGLGDSSRSARSKGNPDVPEPGTEYPIIPVP